MDELKELPTQELQGHIVETLTKPEANLLEGGILIHGFKGNLDPYDSYKNMSDTLTKVVKQGAIVSPSRRELSEKEMARISDAPFDFNRVCFHTWHEEVDGNKSNYVLNAFFAAPVSVIEGYKPSLDPAMDETTVSVFGDNGVEIPLEKGILFLSEELFLEISPEITQKAKDLGITYEEYVKNNIVLLPTEAFEDSKILWNIVRDRIMPATNVTQQLVNPNKMGYRGVNFTDVLNGVELAKMENLGKSEKMNGSPVSDAYATSVMEHCSREINWLKGKEADIENIFEYLDDLRNPNEWLKAVYNSRSLINQLDSDNSRLPAVDKLLNDFNSLAGSLSKQIELFLEQKYPDAPIIKPDNKKLRRNVAKPEVYKDEQGVYHVIRPEI